MAYASISDVRALESARVYTATSQPATAQVALFLDNRAAELDAVLVEKGYSVPIPTSASSARLYLRNLNAIGAWADVQVSAPMAQMRDQAVAMWQNAVAMLRMANTVLDVPKDDTRAYPRGPGVTRPNNTSDVAFDPVVTVRFDSNGNPQDTGTPFFTRSQQF